MTLTRFFREGGGGGRLVTKIWLVCFFQGRAYSFREGTVTLKNCQNFIVVCVFFYMIKESNWNQLFVVFSIWYLQTNYMHSVYKIVKHCSP